MNQNMNRRPYLILGGTLDGMYGYTSVPGMHVWAYTGEEYLEYGCGSWCNVFVHKSLWAAIEDPANPMALHGPVCPFLAAAATA